MTAAKRGGLGKGLDTLIPAGKSTKPAEKPQVKKEIVEVEKVVEKIVEVEKVVEKEVPVERMVKINQVEPNRMQPRTNFDEDSLMELADSIRQHGIIQPIVVQNKGEYFEIIAGERRWRAAKLVGLKEVPVVVKEFSEEQAVEIALIENIQRENLNPIEEALAYKRLLTEFSLKQDEVAERVSKSRTAVTNSMRLLKLNEKVQQMIVDQMISTGHARALLAIEDLDEQYTIAMKIFDEKLSVRETEKLVKNLDKKVKEKKTEKLKNEAIYQDLQEKMKAILGTKVEINRKTNTTGKIEIEYYSEDELDRIIDLLRQIK